jgi:hypothetical protein
MKVFLPGNQKGVTLLELAIASVIMGFTILVALQVLSILVKSTAVSKSTLRADNLLVSTLDNCKNVAAQASYDGTWSSLTSSAKITAYLSPTTLRLGGQAYTVQISPQWVTMTSSSGNPVAVGTVVPYTTVVTCYNPTPACTYTPNYSNMVSFAGTVSWSDYWGPRTISKTAYAGTLRQTGY